MARIFSSGCEEADPLALWSYILPSAKATMIMNVFGRDQFTFAPRTGRGMLLIGRGDGNIGYVRNTFPVTTYTELYYGFAMRAPRLQALAFFRSGCDTVGAFSNYNELRVNVDGSIQAYRDGTSLLTSAAGVITVDTWHYLEVWCKPLNVNGRVVVLVDGVNVLDYTGDSTDDTEYITFYEFLCGHNDQASSPYAYDDIVVNDTTTAVNNTYPGVVRLMPIRPQNAGTDADWTRAGVDLGFDMAQARNGTFEFAMLQTAVADQLVNFDPEIPDLPAGATITNIIVTARSRVQAGAGVIAPMVIANGTVNISADQTLLSAWKYRQYAWALNPEDAAAWAEADLALLEIGVSS
jgi:hypothetical protein